MNKWKFYAILFTFFSLSAIKRTFQTMLTNEGVVESKRKSLSFQICMTTIFVLITIYFWKKS